MHSWLFGDWRLITNSSKTSDPKSGYVHLPRDVWGPNDGHMSARTHDVPRVVCMARLRNNDGLPASTIYWGTIKSSLVDGALQLHNYVYNDWIKNIISVCVWHRWFFMPQIPLPCPNPWLIIDMIVSYNHCNVNSIQTVHITLCGQLTFAVNSIVT